MIFWSLKGKTSWGRAYWKTKSASIFINNIYEDSQNYPRFLSNLLCTYFHEYLHLFLKFHEGQWHNSCKTVIAPLSIKITDALAPDISDQLVHDYWDVYEAYNGGNEQ